jgi:hypothetical protein
MALAFVCILVLGFIGLFATATACLSARDRFGWIRRITLFVIGMGSFSLAYGIGHFAFTHIPW